MYGNGGRLFRPACLPWRTIRGCAVAMMNIETATALLRLQIEWGADIALDEMPHDRFVESPPPMVGEGMVTAASPSENRPMVRAKARPARLDDVPASAAHGASSRSASRPPVATAGGLEDVMAAQDTAALCQAIDRYEGCALRGTATRTVLPEGPVRAPLMVIGDAPDEEEDRSGRPFSGMAGQLLDRMLASIDVPRDRLVLTTAVPWRPPGGRPPSPAEVAACRGLLLRSISLWEPARLLLCGALATRMILGNEASPTRLRGNWRTPVWGGEWGPVRPALAMRHPLQLRAGAGVRREIWGDLLLLSVTLEEDAANRGAIME